MRKRTVKNLFDNIMWYTIYLLPILVALITALSFCGGDWFGAWLEWDSDLTNPPCFAMFREALAQTCYDFQFVPVYATLGESFEVVGGVGTSLDNSPITMYFCYFISVYIAHLFVDFVLFIPRLCHKWMNAFTNAE